MGIKPYQQRRRAKLFAENPFCTECGIEMVLPDDIPKVTSPREKGQIGNLKYFPENLCTIEHPVTKWEPEKRKKSREMLKILCKRCNEKLGADAQINAGIEELHIRSGNICNP